MHLCRTNLLMLNVANPRRFFDIFQRGCGIWAIFKLKEQAYSNYHTLHIIVFKLIVLQHWPTVTTPQ